MTVESSTHGDRSARLTARLDRALLAAQRRVRSQPLLYRLTLGTRVLLAAGFIPTGMVKLLGERFTTMSPDTPLGGFFETLYQSGLYWQFLGATQVVAGVLILLPATATVGALLFTGIIANIFVITLSYDFRGTPVVTGLMLLAALYLVAWDYHRWRGIFGAGLESAAAALPEQRLGRVERWVYAAGAAAGLGFFAGVRGLAVPWSWNRWLLATAALAALAALGLGWRHRRGGDV